MNESAAEPRTYLVGLPVAVTVHTDGTVTYEVDTAEAGAAIAEYENDLPSTKHQQIADIAIVEADHYRRNPHPFKGGDGKTEYTDVCLICRRHESEHPALQEGSA